MYLQNLKNKKLNIVEVITTHIFLSRVVVEASSEAEAATESVRFSEFEEGHIYTNHRGVEIIDVEENVQSKG